MSHKSGMPSKQYPSRKGRIGRPRLYTPEQIAEARRLRAEGRTLTEVSVLTGILYHSLRNYVRGCERVALPPFQARAIIYLCKRGYTVIAPAGVNECA